MVRTTPLPVDNSFFGKQSYEAPFLRSLFHTEGLQDMEGLLLKISILNPLLLWWGYCLDFSGAKIVTFIKTVIYIRPLSTKTIAVYFFI